MLALKLSIPIASWRKGHARELWESEELPPPATCYGALLSLVGECDRERHRGCRITAGLLSPSTPPSTVLRTLWQIKNKNVAQGNGQNAGPDFQQLIINTELLIFCDRGAESAESESLEERIIRALHDPSSVSRFGGWSLGESTHLINDVWLLPDAMPPTPCRTFVCEERGNLTLPVWVDHVGTANTRYVVGGLRELLAAPAPEQLPQIPLT